MHGNPSPSARVMQARLESEMAGGERIEWQAMPIPRWIEPATIAMVLFGIPWTAFAVFWTFGAAYGVSHSPGPWFLSFFPLFGLPFILVGIGLLSSPFWSRRRARNTIYAITDRRALIIQGARSVETKSFGPDALAEITRRERRNGTGDVLFSRKEWRDSDGDRQTREIGFFSIPEPRRVETLLRELHARGRPEISGQT